MEIVETRLGPVEYIAMGKGPPVLYFHGTGITCDGMLPPEEPLAESGFRLIMPNRPGYGKTPLGENRSAAACAHVVAAMLDELEIDTACVMGSSGGGTFATSFAVNHPDRTQCLVLLCPQLHRWSDKSWLPEQSKWTLPFIRYRLLRKLLLKLYGVMFRRMSIEQFLKMEAGSRYDSVWEDEEVQELSRYCLTAMAAGLQHPGFENDMIIFTSEDVVSEDARVTVPTLILYDQQDPMAPQAHIDWFQSLNPEAQAITLHTAGHLVWVGPDANKMHDERVRFMAQHSMAKSDG